MSRARTVVLLLLLLAPGVAIAQPRSPDPASRAVHRTVESGRLRFERNQGQSADAAKFLARGDAYQLFLTDAEAIVRFGTPRTEKPGPLLRLQLVGSRRPLTIAGEQRLTAVTNYFRGPQAEWKTDIANFARVRYQRVYSGVDVVYYGNGQQLEYDFEIAPGASPAVIQVRFAGATGLHRSDSGELVFRVGTRELRQPKPFAFQMIGGVRRQVPVEYRLRNGEVGFGVGEYDPTRTLIIDPIIVYSTYTGGSGDGQALAVASDVNGAAYVAGFTAAVDFPTTPGALRETSNGECCDGFVTKFDAAGDVVYSTYIGGHGSNEVRAIAVDRWGEAYLTGVTFARDFPTTPGTIQPQCVSATKCSTGFVSKLNASGSGLVFSTYFGAPAHESNRHTRPMGIAIDAARNIYIGGWTAEGFPVTPGAFQTFGGFGSYVGFVTKLNPTGTALVYSTFLHAGQEEFVNAIAVDGAGNAYVTGRTTSRSFPTTPGTFQADCPKPDVFGTCGTAFVTKFNATGSALIYSTYLGGSGQSIYIFADSEGTGIAVDPDGFAYVTGWTSALDFPTTPAAFRTTTQTPDAFVTKLNQAGSALVYSTYVGGDAGPIAFYSGADEAWGIALDAQRNAYIAGWTSSSDFPVVDAVQSVFSDGGRDAFVAKLNATGTALTFASYLGGNDLDEGHGVAVDPFGGSVVAGLTASQDFPLVNAANPALLSNLTGFAARIGDPPSCGSEATASVQVFQSGYLPLFFPFALQFAVVWNTSGAPIDGPLAYVMDDLHGAIYAGSSAQTRCFSPERDPLMLVPLGGDTVLAPNEAALMGLWFYQTQPGPISYTPRTLGTYRGR